MGHLIASRPRRGRGRLPTWLRRVSTLLWRKPVLVGDRILFTTQVVGKRPTSKAGLGLVRSRNCGVNQRGETMFEFFASLFAPIVED